MAQNPNMSTAQTLLKLSSLIAFLALAIAVLPSLFNSPKVSTNNLQPQPNGFNVKLLDTAVPGDAIMFKDMSVKLVLSEPTTNGTIRLLGADLTEAVWYMETVKSQTRGFTLAKWVQYQDQSEIFVQQLVSNRVAALKH